MRWRDRRHALTNVVKGAALCWLAGHFLLTALYLLPPSPPRQAVRGLLDLTIGRHFEQNWSLFAPDPIGSNYALLVRGLDAVELAAVARDGLPSDRWYDLSTPLWDAFAQNHLTAYERMSSMLLRGLLAYLDPGREEWVWAESCRRGDPASCALHAAELERLRLPATTQLVLFASAFYADLGLADRLSHVALRLRETRPPPWSERRAAPQVMDFDLGVYPIVRGMSRSGLYTAERGD
jgi:hypothetical protein